jgi:hypothetical protein
MIVITTPQMAPTVMMMQKNPRKLMVIRSPRQEVGRVLFEIPSERENARDADNETAQKLDHAEPHFMRPAIIIVPNHRTNISISVNDCIHSAIKEIIRSFLAG